MVFGPPTTDRSRDHHELLDIFRIGDPFKSFICHDCILGGVHTQGLVYKDQLTWLLWQDDKAWGF